MTSTEIAAFFLHWICWLKETRSESEFAKSWAIIKENQRFVKLPELYRGQIEGFYMGLLAVQEELVSC